MKKIICVGRYCTQITRDRIFFDQGYELELKNSRFILEYRPVFNISHSWRVIVGNIYKMDSVLPSATRIGKDNYEHLDKILKDTE